MVKKDMLRFSVTFPRDQYARLRRISRLFNHSISHFVKRVLLSILRSPDAFKKFCEEYLFDDYSEDEKDIILSILVRLWFGLSDFQSSMDPEDEFDYDDISDFVDDDE